MFEIRSVPRVYFSAVVCPEFLGVDYRYALVPSLLAFVVVT